MNFPESYSSNKTSGMPPSPFLHPGGEQRRSANVPGYTEKNWYFSEPKGES